MAIDKSKTDLIKAKYEELTGTLSDPAVASRPEEYTKYSKELASLNPQVEAIRNYEACEKEIEGIITLLESGDLGGDDEMRSLANAELADAKDRLADLEKELMIYLTPGDPRDSRSVILEIRAGAGGEAQGHHQGNDQTFHRDLLCWWGKCFDETLPDFRRSIMKKP